MKNKILLTTSIVIYNPNLVDLEILFKSYKVSLLKAQIEYDIHSKITIVDNNSKGNYSDQVKLMLDNADINYEYIYSIKNGGYGYGHNQAILKESSDYHIICNPDIEFFEDTISNAIDYMQIYSDISLITPAVFGKDNERHFLCKRNPKLFHLFLRRFVSNKIKGRFFKTYLERFEFRDKSYEQIIENIPFCTGCFMFFSMEVLKQLNGFDERFFMYMEDADLSRRAMKFGRNIYLPSCRVIHRWERGAYKNKKLRNEAIKSAFKYWRKWGGLF